MLKCSCISACICSYVCVVTACKIEYNEGYQMPVSRCTGKMFENIEQVKPKSEPRQTDRTTEKL